jgi:MFS family permease
LIICFGTNCIQLDLCLVNFIFYYGTTFFLRSGISNPFVITIATNIVNVFMTLPGMWGVERFGRRRLLLVGAIGMCVCEYIVAIVAVTISVDNIAGQKVLIAIVCTYIVGSVPLHPDIVVTSICRLSLHQLGDLLLGSSLAKSSHYKFVRRPCHSPLVSSTSLT